MELLRLYGTQTDIYFPLIKAASANFAVSGDYTHASGDVKVSKDGGAAATATNSPSAITMGNGAMWKLTLTATEMQAALIMVTIIDASTKAVEDQAILINTYGNASAQHEFNLDVATQSVAVASIAANAITTASINDGALTEAKFATDFLTAAKVAADVGTEIAAAVWDALTSGLSTASSIGKLLVDNVNATISSRASQTSVDTIDDFVDTEVAAIKAKTDNLPASPAATGDIPSASTIATAVLGEALSEPSGVFTWAGATLGTVMAWMGALARNKITQDSTETVLRNDDDDGDIATSAISGAGGTFTRDEWT